MVSIFMVSRVAKVPGLTLIDELCSLRHRECVCVLFDGAVTFRY